MNQACVNRSLRSSDQVAFRLDGRDGIAFMHQPFGQIQTDAAKPKAKKASKSGKAKAVRAGKKTTKKTAAKKTAKKITKKTAAKKAVKKVAKKTVKKTVVKKKAVAKKAAPKKTATASVATKQARPPRGTVSPQVQQQLLEILVQKRSVLEGDVTSLKEGAFKPSSLNISVDHMADFGTDNYDQEFNLMTIAGLPKNSDKAFPLFRLRGFEWRVYHRKVGP